MILFGLWMLQYIKYSACKKSLHVQVIKRFIFRLQQYLQILPAASKVHGSRSF